MFAVFQTVGKVSDVCFTVSNDCVGGELAGCPAGVPGGGGEGGAHSYRAHAPAHSSCSWGSGQLVHTAAAAGAQVSWCTQLLQLGLRSVGAHSCCSWGSGQLVHTAAAAGAQVSWCTQLLQLGLRSVGTHSCSSWGTGHLVHTAAAAGAQVSWYTQLLQLVQVSKYTQQQQLELKSVGCTASEAVTLDWRCTSTFHTLAAAVDQVSRYTQQQPRAQVSSYAQQQHLGRRSTAAAAEVGASE
jgi:hypothetical protein